MVNGNFVSEDGTVLKGQDIVKDLLGRCLIWSEVVLERYEYLARLRLILMVPKERKDRRKIHRPVPDPC